MLQEENNIIKQVEVETNLIKCSGRTVAAATGRGFESRRPDFSFFNLKEAGSEAFIESHQHSSGASEVPLQSDTMTISRAQARARIAFTLRLSPQDSSQTQSKRPPHVYEVRRRKGHRGVDLTFALVIVRRIAASAAESLNRIIPTFFSTPNCLQRSLKSTGNGEAFIFSYNSLSTGTPVASSPIRKALVRGHSVSMVPPAARTARNASSKPFRLPVRFLSS